MSGRYRPRPYLPGQVGPRASLVILRELGASLNRLAEALACSPIPENRQVASEVLGGIESMRESARLWAERTADVAADGNAAMSKGVGRSVSEVPPRDRLTVGQVAARTGLKERRIRQLCQSGGSSLAATKAAGVWWIDAESVDLFETTRRPIR